MRSAEGSGNDSAGLLEPIRLVGVCGFGAALIAAFFMYQSLRCLGETFGVSIWMSLVALVLTAVMVAPLAGVGIWVFTTEDPRRRRARERYERGQCPGCGYAPQIAGLARCPECGGSLGAPEEADLPLRWRGPAASLVAVIGAGLLTGSALGEAWMLADEAAFRQEAAGAVAGGKEISRARRWPNESAGLMYTPAKGFFSHD